MQEIAPPARPGLLNEFDYPRAAFGSDEVNDGKALWVCFDNVFNDPTTTTGIKERKCMLRLFR